jgi:propanediol utilization protein
VHLVGIGIRNLTLTFVQSFDIFLYQFESIASLHQILSDRFQVVLILGNRDRQGHKLQQVPKCYGLLFGKGTTLQEIQTLKNPGKYLVGVQFQKT